MKRHEFYKKLDNLRSWKFWAMSGAVPNIDEADKVDRQIAELQHEFDTSQG